MKLFAITLLAGLLAGCIAIPPRSDAPVLIGRVEDIQTFSLSGRIAVRAAEHNNSGKLYWQASKQRDELTLANPLGQGVAKLERDAAGVRLLTADKEYAAPDAETLTQEVLGWRLPLTGLTDWVLGRAAPGDVTASQRDAVGRLVLLVQQGWRIEYGEYGEAGQDKLPTRIRLTRLDPQEKFEIRLVIDSWETGK